MSKRTFILSLGKEDKEAFEDNDIINTIMLRIAEVYLDVSQKTDIGIELLSSIQDLVRQNIVKDENSFVYSVDIDFEKDVIK